MWSQVGLGSITMNKASGGDGIPAELNPKKWCCESAALNTPANLENSAVASGLEKFSFHSNPKSNGKECSNYRTIVLISSTGKAMLKILQVRLQQYVNHELPDVQAGLRRGRGTRTRTILTNHCSVPMSRNSSCEKYVNWELLDVQARFTKGREPEMKLPTSIGSLKKQASSRETSISALLTMPKPLIVWITTHCGKFFKRQEYQTT